jgi:acyl-CoA hydrolase
MSNKSVLAKSTIAVGTHIVLPENTNTLGNLMGGQLLHWMDIASAISAHRHCHRIVVTIEAKVSRSFSSSMEVFMEVFVEHHTTGERTRCNEAIYTFVAVDQMGAPIPVPELIPETEEEKRRYDGALRRR